MITAWLCARMRPPCAEKTNKETNKTIVWSRWPQAQSNCSHVLTVLLRYLFNYSRAYVCTVFLSYKGPQVQTIGGLNSECTIFWLACLQAIWGCFHCGKTPENAEFAITCPRAMAPAIFRVFRDKNTLKPPAGRLYSDNLFLLTW